MDHILTNSKSLISHQGVIKLGISDHDLIYCIRKIKAAKSGKHNTLCVRSFKNYTKNAFVNDLRNGNLPDYSLFENINEEYNHFINFLIKIIDKNAPFKNIRVKGIKNTW